MSDKPRGRAPWSMEQREESFVILDADGRELFLVPYRKPYHKPNDRMKQDEALKFVRAVLRLPELLRAGGKRETDA